MPMMKLAAELFPLNRSLTGAGNEQTLAILQREVPRLRIRDFPSGMKAFDWTVPEEWIIREAWIEDPAGNRILDFRWNNLHVMGYSESVDKRVSATELNQHLYSLPETPTAIPYITSYYERRWGFCMRHDDREALEDGMYRVRIDAEHFPGRMVYGELILPGREEKEVLLSTYICHPSMANNEVSGMVVTAELAKWLMQEERRYTYRILFMPETIGAIAYLSRNWQEMCEKTVAGYCVTCVGDDRSYSLLPSRQGDTLADRAALAALRDAGVKHREFDWIDRGSDERQYCSPGIDLPVASLMRTKHGEYREYHTSLDNLDVISEAGLQGGFDVLRRTLEIIESNCLPVAAFPCEPNLGKRGLYSTLSNDKPVGRELLDVLTYCDGTLDTLAICERLQKPIKEVAARLDTLRQYQLIKE